jgi:hypothetical protein
VWQYNRGGLWIDHSLHDGKWRTGDLYGSACDGDGNCGNDQGHLDCQHYGKYNLYNLDHSGNRALD